MFSIGGNVVLLTVVAYLGKVVIEKSVLRDTKVFEARLNSTTDSEIERLKAEMNRTIETHKTRLKFSEAIFQRELDAASAMAAVSYKHLPTFSIAANPWHQIKPMVALQFGPIESSLLAFSERYAVVLNESEIVLLHECKGLSILGQLYVNVETKEISDDALVIAAQLYTQVNKLAERIRQRVRSQANSN